MECRRQVAIIMAVCLLANAFALPAPRYRGRRGSEDNELGDSMKTGVGEDSDAKNLASSTTSTSSSVSLVDVDKEMNDESFEDEDFEEQMQPAATGGSNIFSLLRLATALFPASGSSNLLISRMFREILGYNPGILLRRQDVGDNEIIIDYVQGLKPPPPPFQRQRSDEESGSSESASDESDDDNGGEESLEENGGNGEDDGNRDSEASDQNSDESNRSNDSEFDSDEGNGQGGGLLGLLAGLSGGQDGQSDLGDLLTTVSGIVAQLSGDGIDLNSLIGSGLGLFVGLLSEGDENPGTLIAGYLLSALEAITGGGAKNNGAFFGNLVSKLIKGTSAADDEEDDDDESGEGNRMKMADSAGFFASLLMSLLGEMSKSSSGGSSQPQAWKRYYMERLKKLDNANQR